MTLLTLCQDVARNIPVEVPLTIVGNANETASLLLSCAKRTGQDLYRRHNWVALVTEYTFNTANGTADYSLPSDYGRLVNETLWDRANYEQMRGPLSPVQWQEYKSSILASTAATWKRYRIRNVSGTVMFSIFPTPSAVEGLVFEYVSKNWCESSGGTGQDDWAADTDVPVLDEHLFELGMTWRMLDRLGLAYDEQKEEYEREVAKAKARDGGAPTLRISSKIGNGLLSPANVPDTGYGS